MYQKVKFTYGDCVSKQMTTVDTLRIVCVMPRAVAMDMANTKQKLQI